MKRLFSLLLVCVLLVGVVPIAASAVTNVNEKTSDNDSEETAQQIYHDYQVSASLDGLFGDDIMDYYKFEMKSAGKVTILAMSLNTNFGFRLDSESGYVTGSSDDGSYEGYHCEILDDYYLSAGTYYISFVGTDYSDFTYYFSLNAPAATKDSSSSGGSEIVDMTGLSLANPYEARLSTTYSHTWNWDNQRYDTYYARFTTTEPGYVELFCYAFTPSDEMIYTLYNAAGEKIWSSGTENCYSKNMSLFVCLEPGTYIYAAEMDFYLDSDETYNANFFVKFYPEEYVAGEPNDSKETAKKVEFGVEYFAINGEISTTDDYWKIDMEEDGRVLIYLPQYSYMKGMSDGSPYIYNSEGERVSWKAYQSAEGYCIPVDLTKGSNYFVYGRNGSYHTSYENAAQVEYSFRAELHECEYEEKVTKEATCYWDGSKTVTCAVCGYDEKVTIPKTEHDWAQYKVNKEATFTEDGEVVMKCTMCGKQEKKVIPALGGGNMTNPFVDVDESMFCYDSVLWAFYSDITTGKDVTHFNPSGNCTRSQVVTFLWRAAGEPEPQSGVNPFPDVPEGKFYTKAVLWAVENNITAGFKDGTFGPDATCTRAQIVTFLWRYASQPEPNSLENPFPDVNADAYYGKAVLWAVEKGITGGYKDGTFGPNKTCKRDQIVTFLYRYMVE